MSKQYAILTKNPAAGRPEWHAESGIAFNSRAAAENSKVRTIECLRRAGDRMDGRDWLVVEIDWSGMVPAKFGLWQVLKLVRQFIRRPKESAPVGR